MLPDTGAHARHEGIAVHVDTLIEDSAPCPIGLNHWQYMVAPDDTPDMMHERLGTPIATYRYSDAEGDCIGYVARYLKAGGGDEYRAWTYGTYSENVKAKWTARTWGNRTNPLYGLDLLAKNPGRKVCLVWSESAADAVRVLLGGMVGIGWASRLLRPADIDWSPLAGRDVLMIPDADTLGLGEQTAHKIAARLLALGCKPVRLADTSGMPDKWDAASALADGWTAQTFVEWIKPLITPLTSREAEKSKHLVVEVAPRVALDIPEVMPANIKPHTGIKTDIDEIAPEFSDVHIAEVWSGNEGKDWLYCHGREHWVRWDGNRWVIDRRKSAVRIVANQLKQATAWPEAIQLSSKDRRALCGISKINSVMKYAATMPSIARIPDDFDSDPFLLGTPGGTLDLRTGELRPARREDYITRQTAVTPQKGPMPQWEKVLDRCTAGDQEMRKYYQRWAGYTLTGDCREEAFLFVHGPGSSGKSKFIDCIGDILGQSDKDGYCATAKIEMLMESKHERHTEEIASLAGARMVRTSEPDEGARWNEALLKLITGRDTVSARHVYGKQFTFRPEFKLFVSGNFKPAFRSTGEEISRRMHFAEFAETIPENERISNLPELLREEWPAILAWMVEGCLEWQRIGLARPATINAATQEYLVDEDTLGRWVGECCTVGDSLKAQVSDAYKSYKAYVEAAGEGVVSQKRFSQRMEARGFRKKRTPEARYFVGLAVGFVNNASVYDDGVDDF